MLLLIHREARHVEYVSVVCLVDKEHADMTQTGVDRGQLPTDNRANLWTFADHLISSEPTAIVQILGMLSEKLVCIAE
jgi:hypothetical protein